MGVYRRGNMLWIRYQDAEGKWKAAASGFRVGDEGAAQAMLAELEAAIATRQPSDVVAANDSRGPRVRAYAAEWLKGRLAANLDYASDESRMRNHILPTLGDMYLRDVRARDLIALFHGIRTNPERPIAQRTVYNVYSVVSAMFRDAQLAGLIDQTPCMLDARQLGPLVDKNPEWRSSAVFSRDEAETLIGSPLIPEDRRAVYALELLAGLRTGEAAALRWRHWEPEVRPLGRLLVATSYNSRKNVAKSTKTNTSKHVPVHPALASILSTWRTSGWAAMMGREPTPDDLIVPLPPASVSRRRGRTGEPFRGYDYSGKKWREVDLPALGWRHRRHYDMRATFITLAVEDGADPEVIETRITHAKKARSAFAGYNRGGPRWEATCAELAKLRIRAPGQDAPAAGGAVTVAVTLPLQSPTATHATTENPEGFPMDDAWRRRESNPRPRTPRSRLLRV